MLTLGKTGFGTSRCNRSIYNLSVSECSNALCFFFTTSTSALLLAHFDTGRSLCRYPFTKLVNMGLGRFGRFLSGFFSRFLVGLLSGFFGGFFSRFLGGLLSGFFGCFLSRFFSGFLSGLLSGFFSRFLSGFFSGLLGGFLSGLLGRFLGCFCGLAAYYRGPLQFFGSLFRDCRGFFACRSLCVCSCFPAVMRAVTRSEQGQAKRYDENDR